MTIALDVHNSGSQSGYYSNNAYGYGVTSSITTTHDNEIIVAILSSVSVNGQSSEYNGYVPFANVGDNTANQSGGTGLVWQRRSQTQYKIDSNTFVNIEVWWAHQPLAGRIDVYASTANVCDGTQLVLLGVSGASTTEPWDTNAALNMPVETTGGNPTTLTTTYSTTAAATLALAIGTDFTYANAPTAYAGWTNAESVQNGDGSQYKELTVATLVNASTVSGGTGGFTWPGTTNKLCTLIDALVAAGGTGVPDAVAMSIDGTAVGNFSSTNTGTVTLTTANTNDVIVVAVNSRLATGGPKTVSSVAASGLTFVQRKAYNPSDDTPSDLEVWWAIASAALTAKVITVNLSGTVDGCVIQAFGVTGANVSGNTWDGTTPLTTQNTGAVTPSCSGYTSTEKQGIALIFGLTMYPSSGVLLDSNNTSPGGWTEIGVGKKIYDGNANIDIFVYQQGCNAGAVSAGAAWGDITANASQVSAFIMDFMVSAQQAFPPTGTMAPTEATDTFAATGGLVGGAWASTEAKDIMAFSVPPAGVWTSVDTKDAMAFIGYPELTGTWASVDGTDALSMTGHFGTPTTWDPATASTGVDLENMNLTATNTLAYNDLVGVRSTTFHTSGLWYTEFNANPLTANNSGVGVINASGTAAGWGNSAAPATNGAGIFVAGNGTIWINGVQQTNWAGVALTTANIGIAIDLTHNLIWFRTNGGLWNGLAWGDPTKPPGGLNSSNQDINNGGYGIAGIAAGGLYLWAEIIGAYDQVTMNTGASAFAHAAPSGFNAWDAVAVAASPLQIDGYATEGHSEVSGDSYAAVTSGEITLSTSQDDDVIVIGIVMGGYYNTSTVATVTDTAGLTWHRRNRRWQGGGQKVSSSTTVNRGLDIETWWAHAPTPLSADVITVTPTAGVGAMSLIAFGVSGANYSAPWDTHTLAGGYVDQGGGFYTPASAQLYTNAPNAFLFGIQGDTNADYGTAAGPWTYVAYATSTEHDGWTSFASLIYQTVDEPQEAVDVQVNYNYSGNIYGSATSMMFDSIVAVGETGTAKEIVWFWDPNNISGGSPSGVNGTLELSAGAPNLVLGYSASNFNLMVLLQVLIQSASGTGEVTAIGESQGLVSSAGFERRSRVVTATAHGTIAQEIWWAWMPMYTTKANNDQITIYTSGTAVGDIVSAQMCGLGGTTGAFGLGDPFWDPNVSLPTLNSSPGNSPIPNVTDMTTNEPSDLLVAWTANITEPEPGFTDPFVTLVQAYPKVIAPTLNFVSAAPPANLGFEFLYTSSLVSNETAEFNLGPSPGEPVGWLMIGDAIPVGPPQPPSGTWTSVEHKDTFTHTGDYSDIGIASPGGWVGFTPIEVVWASTEHADEFTGAPPQAPYDSIGWLGWVPGSGTMAATDTPDHALFDGWLLGFGGITGQIRAVEARDRFGASNRATVTGTWASAEAKDRWASNGYLIPLAGPPRGIRKRRLLIVT